MLTVTAGAKEKHKESLPDQPTDPEVAIEITSDHPIPFSSLCDQRDMMKKYRLTFSPYVLFILLVCCLVGIVPGCIELNDELESNCFNWPEKEFSPIDFATFDPHIRFKPCDRAVDFTLKDPSGEQHTLSTLLATKPVLLVFGAFT
jgi:hypothetical protein